MGLRDDIQTDLGIAFDTDLADAVKIFEFTSRGDSSYDTNTGLVSTTDQSAFSRGVFNDPTQDQLQDSNVRPTDVVITILQNELTLVPKPNDFLTVETTKEFTVYKVKEDPADASWEVYARRGNDND